jgi:hypothetical protein
MRAVVWSNESNCGLNSHDLFVPASVHAESLARPQSGSRSQR